MLADAAGRRHVDGSRGLCRAVAAVTAAESADAYAAGATPDTANNPADAVAGIGAEGGQ